MKTFILFVIALVSIFSIKAQTLQTYKGIFESGTAVYQYYENQNSDRIYNGSFNYAGNPYTVVGQFKENQRIGKWKITAANKTFKNEKGKIQLNTTVTGRYTLGSMDSTWTFSKAIKNFNPKTKKFAPKAEITKSTSNFKDNHFVGKISYEKGITTKTTINGQFNEAGFPDGTWTFKSIKEVEELKYKDGVLISRIVKDITTGDKKISEDKSMFIDDFWKNYDKKTKISAFNGKMYIVDTINFQNIATEVWQNEFVNHEVLGNVLNPIYAFKRSQISPTAYQIVFVECDGNSDCYIKYTFEKNAELERIKKEQEEEAERLRLEALAKEEQIRIEKEKELERQRLEQLANAERIGDEFFAQKKYRNAINQYVEVNKMSYSEKIIEKISKCEQEIIKIDSLHRNLRDRYEILKGIINPSFETAYGFQSAVKAKKNVYGVNYLLCLDFMKKNIIPQFETLSYIEKNDTGIKEFWTESNQKSLEEIEILMKQMEEVNKFYSAVNDAVTKNNKTKMRVLNSSLNPKIIIQSMIDFK